MVITGHDHTGYGIIKSKGVTFINPGSLMRTSASTSEINRKINVVICTIKYKTATCDLHVLTSALPGRDVLDRSKIDETRERNYAMEEFSTLLKSKYDGKVERIDIFSIITKIAELEFIEPRLVDIAIAKIKSKL
jgi:exonuclease SbcD